METDTFPVYLLRFPLFLVWLAGLALALKHWQRHPEVSRPILVALVALLIANVVDPYVSQQIQPFAREQGFGAEGFGMLLMIKGMILTLVTAGAWGLALWAAWRPDGTDLISEQSNLT